MATHLIVDGYNLLGSTQGFSGGLESGREQLVRLLAAYRHRKHYPITVVFDGWGQDRTVEQRGHRTGVEVVYSKRGEKADQVIQRLVRQYGSDCAVVSSDHEIIAVARSYGAFVMQAQEFADKLMVPSSSHGTQPYKELDRGDDEKPARGPEKKGNPKKLPKAQRRRQGRLRRF